MATERTFSILKPDATRRNLTGKINAKFEESGLRIIAQKRVQLSKQQAEGFYGVHKERPFFNDLVKFMISGPVMIQVLEGEGAIAKNRELMGATGLLTLDLLERDGLLAPGGFVGVDLDPARIDAFRRQRPDLKWVAGNLYERLEAPELAGVGVLNLDEYGEVGNPSAEADFPLIRSLVKRGLDTFGEFALFWNQDLDAVVRRQQDRGQALRRHADMVCEALRGCLPRRELTSDMLLPAGSEAASGSDFVGVVGAFEIYRGSVRWHRMANLRVILR